MFDSKEVISKKNREFFINKFIWRRRSVELLLRNLFAGDVVLLLGAEVLGRKTSNLEIEFQIGIGVELKAGLVSRRLDGVVVGNIVAKVLLDDVVGELVNLDIFVVLEVFDLRQAVAFLNQIGDLFCVLSSHLKHVVNSVQDYLKIIIKVVTFRLSFKVESTYVNNLRIMAAQQLTERRNGSSLNQVCYLLLIAANRQVADGPCGLFLCLELSLRQVLDNLGQKPGVNDGLNL